MEKRVLNYRVIIEPDKRIGTNKPCYVAYCPTLGIADDGDTVDEALAQMKEGIECHIGSLAKEGVEIPAPDNITKGIVTSTEVTVPRKVKIASVI